MSSGSPNLLRAPLHRRQASAGPFHGCTLVVPEVAESSDEISTGSNRPLAIWP